MAEVATFAYRDHLVGLVARAEAAAARLAVAGTADAREELAARSRREAARLSTRLDASPLDDETADAVDAGSAERPTAAAPGGAEGRAASSGWAAALRLDGLPTQEVAAVEYANVLACHDLEGHLAEEFFAAPLSSLVALHSRLVEGLVDPERAGRVRDLEHDVHDGTQGQVIYRAPLPRDLPGLLDALVGWIGHGSAGVPAVVVAGVVHGRLLQWQPFDSANGRLARAAARVVLRARGLDPDALAVPEAALARDPRGYFREIAAAMRRRGDLTGWLERTGEAVAWGLERAVDALEGGPPDPPPRARGVAAGLGPGESITLPDYAEAAGVDRDTAAGDLEALRRSGWLVPEPGSRGLRLRRH